MEIGIRLYDDKSKHDTIIIVQRLCICLRRKKIALTRSGCGEYLEYLLMEYFDYLMMEYFEYLMMEHFLHNLLNSILQQRRIVAGWF